MSLPVLAAAKRKTELRGFRSLSCPELLAIVRHVGAPHLVFWRDSLSTDTQRLSSLVPGRDSLSYPSFVRCCQIEKTKRHEYEI